METENLLRARGKFCIEGDKVSSPLRWYALKVFHNRYSAITSTLARDGVESYIPMRSVLRPQANGEVVEKRVPVIAMLMFLRCDDDYILHLNQVLQEKAMVYHHPGTDLPAAIPDREMEQFILLTTAYESCFEPKPYDQALLTKALQRYRIVEGELSGIEGYNCRIQKDRRFIVPVSNLLMLVSTYHIPQRYLQGI